MLKIEGVVPVQEAEVNMGDDDVGTTEAVIEGVAENVIGRRTQEGSSSNIAKHLKRARRVHMLAAVRLSPYITPRSRRYGP